jgi:hypothetical protein
MITGLGGKDLSEQITTELQKGAVLHGQPFHDGSGRICQAVVYLGHFHAGEQPDDNRIMVPPEPSVLRPV